MTATGDAAPVPTGRSTRRVRLPRLGVVGRRSSMSTAVPAPAPVPPPSLPPVNGRPPDTGTEPAVATDAPPTVAAEPGAVATETSPAVAAEPGAVATEAPLTAGEAPASVGTEAASAATDPAAVDTEAPADTGTGVEVVVQRRRRAGDLLLRGTLATGQVAAQTCKKAWHDRVLGLAAEAGFWQLLSLPPLLLSLLGAIGYLGDWVGHGLTQRVEHSVLTGAGHLLTSHVVNEQVRPTVEQILGKGRPDVISIGFVLSLWTGSTAMNTFVNTITIAYGLRGSRSAVRSRILALKLYLAQIATGIVILPALIVGPAVLVRPLHGSANHTARAIVETAYWPAVALLSLAILTTLYHLSPPIRPPWRRAVPGAVLALVLWLVGSYGLRLYLKLVFTGELVYGSFAAPVAVLLFFYITALAVLLGAELNASIELRRHGRAAGGTR